MLLKQRWARAQKDPSRSIKDQFIDVNSYWQQLKNLPPKGIEKIVNDRIIEADQRGCDYILNRIYTDKQVVENKLQLQQLERFKLRNRLRETHNKALEFEK